MASPKLMSHKAAHYRAAPSDSKRCGVCSMYTHDIPPSCSLVEKPIRPFDLCDFYSPKTKETKRAA